MHFSSFAESFPQTLNRLYQARDRIIQSGRPIVDLVSGNVHQAGIRYPPDLLQEILIESLPASEVYQPDSFGQAVARRAIAHYYQCLDVNLPPNQILLTPGTSISYFYCFKLLAEPGDEILCPSPSYPLFETIAKLCGVELTSYPLREADGWAIDLDYLEARITTRTRAIVIISPHNPTGAVASDEELDRLASICVRHELPVISDEVFSEFLFGLEHLPRPSQTCAPLVFTLNGLSKVLALPGFKVGWIGVSGDATLVQRTLRALEMISDTFLPVNELAQFAVPKILERGRSFLNAYRRDVQLCRDLVVETLSGTMNFRCIPPAGGFYLTICWTGLERDEEQLAIDLLNQCDVLVHPGFFYDIKGTHLVFTFIQDPAILKGTMRRVKEYLG